MSYAVATFIVLCVIEHRFDLKTYLIYLIGFNIQAPYYYLVFYMQLLMVSPLMVRWCAFTNKKKHKWVIHLGTLGFFGWFAYICINYTYVLPVHGGGKFVCGGTYVILYYVGMLLMSNGVFAQNINIRLFLMFISLAGSIVWISLMTEGRLPFDVWMSPYWGSGENPPSVNYMVYSLLILFLCYSSFSLLSEWKNRIIGKLMEMLCLFGKNTLYIWLYHLLIITFIVHKFPQLIESNVLIRLLGGAMSIILPTVIKILIVLFLREVGYEIFRSTDA